MLGRVEDVSALPDIEQEIQGEALGILSSANAAALVLSPLFAASFVGAHPVWVFWISSGGMLLAAALVLLVYGRRLIDFKGF